MNSELSYDPKAQTQKRYQFESNFQMLNPNTELYKEYFNFFLRV